MADVNLAARSRFILILLAIVAATGASCILRSGQQYRHFSTPTPIAKNDTLILGFMGGRDAWNNTSVGVGRIARRLRERGLPGVHVETVENKKRDLGVRLVRSALDANRDGQLQSSERRQARIVVYGQSFGGAAVVKFARQLDALGIPILLTIQVDSVGRGDGMIPPNVRAAANIYQDNGRLIRGEAPIRADDPSRTEILGNFRFDYANSPIDVSDLPWYKTLARIAHAKMDRDPEVWKKVEALILDALGGGMGGGTFLSPSSPPDRNRRLESLRSQAAFFSQDFAGPGPVGELLSTDPEPAAGGEAFLFFSETGVGRAGIEPATLCLKGRCSTD